VTLEDIEADNWQASPWSDWCGRLFNARDLADLQWAPVSGPGRPHPNRPALEL